MINDQSRADDEESWFDADIDAMELSYFEKSGLQVYRNYTNSFDIHAIKNFVNMINAEKIDTAPLVRLLGAIATDDPRILPLIVCSFADETLKAVFKEALPDDIPGGKANLLGGYGPLSDLSKRVKLAHAFNFLSGDLMVDIDHLRAIRNDISHTWDLTKLNDFFVHGRAALMRRIEETIMGDERFANLKFPSGHSLVAFRVRLIWISGRLTYERAAYTRAKAARLQPPKALYGTPVTNWLREIAALCVDQTRHIVRRGEA